MKLPDATIVPRKIEDTKQSVSVDVMSRLVLSLVDGQATINEIGEAAGLDAELVQRIIIQLAESRLLEVPGMEFRREKNEDSAKSAQPNNAPSTDIECIFADLNQKNFYEILGVKPDAKRSELRTKYFELSKRYHPDKIFGANDKELRHKTEIVFRKLTEAYETLTNGQRRAQYDASIADELKLISIENELKSAMQREPNTASKIIEKAKESEPPKIKTSNASRHSAPVREKIKPSRPSRPARDAKHKQWQRERAGRAVAAILHRTSISPLPLAKVKTRIQEAELALEQKHFREAIDFLREALSIDPENTTVKEMVKKAIAGQNDQRAQNYIRQGLIEARQGDLFSAEKNYNKALECDSSNLEARHLLAELLLNQSRDLPRALTLCKEVIALGGQRARYFATLGELLLLAKDFKRAYDAFSKALSKEPDNKEYAKRLKMCKK